MFRIILNFLFPLKCVICSQQNARAVCKTCCENLMGKMLFRKDLLPLNHANYCNKTLPIWSLCIYEHESDFAKLIKRFKYKFTKELASIFAENLYMLLWQKMPTFLSADETCFCPVPSSYLRTNWRGYNQAVLCAAELSKITQIPVWNGAKRKNDNQHQVGLNAAQRRNNLKSAFFVNKSPPKNVRRIIFIDDVVTTGSTLRELWSTCLAKYPNHEFAAICLASRLVF